jgi:hypothetical protein
MRNELIGRWERGREDDSHPVLLLGRGEANQSKLMTFAKEIIKHVCVLNFTSSLNTKEGVIFVVYASWFPHFQGSSIHIVCSVCLCFIMSMRKTNVNHILTWSRFLSVLKTRIHMFLVSIMWMAPYLCSFILFNMIKNTIKEIVSATYQIHFSIVHLCRQKDIVLFFVWR